MMRGWGMGGGKRTRERTLPKNVWTPLEELLVRSIFGFCTETKHREQSHPSGVENRPDEGESQKEFPPSSLFRPIWPSDPTDRSVWHTRWRDCVETMGALTDNYGLASDKNLLLMCFLRVLVFAGKFDRSCTSISQEKKEFYKELRVRFINSI